MNTTTPASGRRTSSTPVDGPVPTSPPPGVPRQRRGPTPANGPRTGGTAIPTGGPRTGDTALPTTGRSRRSSTTGRHTPARGQDLRPSAVLAPGQVLPTGRVAPVGHGQPVSADAAGRRGVLRVALHLLLAALPLLAISAHVFGLVQMQLSAALLVIPLAMGVVALCVFAPHGGDRVLAHGMVWGIVACAVYDVFRLDTVYMLGWWADFIPTMGTWITGDPDNLVSGAIVGYLWRYVGDGGGIGITFFAVASALGLHRRSRGVVVAAAVGFAVVPVWAGLILTVWAAPRGQAMMFPLTPLTLTLSLVGHLIFGLILGLGFWHSKKVQEHWPWEPLTGVQRAISAGAPPAAPEPRALPAAVDVPPTTGTSDPHPTDGAATPVLPGPRPAPDRSGQAIGPETWELWQRQIDTTIRGRRTHRSR